jgi:hypothetical protein
MRRRTLRRGTLDVEQEHKCLGGERVAEEEQLWALLAEAEPEARLLEEARREWAVMGAAEGGRDALRPWASREEGSGKEGSGKEGDTWLSSSSSREKRLSGWVVWLRGVRNQVRPGCWGSN